MKKGFTLIEILVVVGIIGILSSLFLVVANGARARSRDAKRVSEIIQVQKALDLYYDKYGRYPATAPDAGCGGLDVGNTGKTFLDVLKTEKFFSKTPTDPTATGCGGFVYLYYLTANDAAQCPDNKGNYYILGIRLMESSKAHYNSNPPWHHPTSPGFKCPNRDWQSSFDWVTGGFER